MNKNINYKVLFFFIIFSILYLIFLVTHYTNNLSLFFDIPAMFFSVISDFDNPNKNYFMYIAFDNVRLFSNFLLALPFNIIGIPLAEDSILSLSNFYSLSYLLMHMFALFINYFVARRTKRYDIAVIAFAFYVICSLPNIIWAVREVHFAVLLYFPLVSYFLSKEKLNKFDFIPISLLVIYLFESFEITPVLGVLLFIFANLYMKKNDKNHWHKVFIGFVSLLATIYIPLKVLYFMAYKNLVFTEGFGIQEWITGSKLALSNLFCTNLIIFVFAFIAIIATIFYKKEYNFKTLFFIVPFFMILYFVLYTKTGLYPSVHKEMHNYSLVFWFIYPVILTLLLLDYKNIQIKEYFITNLFILACVFGSFNLAWQIHTNIEFGKYTDALENIMDKSEDGIIEIPKQEYESKKYIHRCNTCFSTMPASIILADEKDVDKVIVPSDYFYDDSQWCFDTKKYTHYDKKEDVLKLQTAIIEPESSLLDVTDIVEEFKEEGLVKK